MIVLPHLTTTNGVPGLRTLFVEERSAPWEWLLVSAAVACALALGFANLGHPSLWHDELVHVFVGKSIAETGKPLLPSGEVYTSGTAFNYVLGAFIALFGSGESAVRTPSVLASGLNVALLYLLLRPLIGRGPALVAAFSLALSPWCVAWSRQARFYAMQQSAYLLFALSVLSLWRSMPKRIAIAPAIGLVASYLLGILSSFHSILFLPLVCAIAGLGVIIDRDMRKRWFALGVLGVVAGIATYGTYRLTFTPLDYTVLTQTSAVGGNLPGLEENRDHSDRYYYFRFLMNNLSQGYFVLALVGFIAMVALEGRRGAFVALAFLAPVLVMTYLIGYRMHRFMYFAYPFYVAAHAYGTVALLRYVVHSQHSAIRSLSAVFVVLFLCMAGVSTFKLLGDTFETASGSDITLARRHPQWRKPCLAVRDRLGEGDAVLCTTYLPSLYYVGRCDEWYPSRYTWPEATESGTPGLAGVAELKEFIKIHPTGYFIAEFARFDRWDGSYLDEDVDWVRANMRLMPALSSEDVSVFYWESFKP